MRRYLAWLAAAAIGVAAVVIAAVAILLATADRQRLADELRDSAASALDTPVKIGAVARGQLWPPQLILRDVRVGPADEPPRLAAATITVEAATLPLTRRELAVRRIALAGVTVDASQWAGALDAAAPKTDGGGGSGDDRTGTGDGRTGEPATREAVPAWLQDLQAIEARDLKLRTHAGGWQWNLARATLEADNAGGLVRGPARLQARAGKGDEAARLAATLERDGATLRADPLAWQAAESRLSGTATLAAGAAPPRFGLALDGPHLALERLAPSRQAPAGNDPDATQNSSESAASEREGNGDGPGTGVEGPMPLPWDGLARAQADLSVRADRLVPPQGPAARDGALKLRLEGGRLTLEELQARWGDGGTLAVSGSAQRTGDGEGTAALSVSAEDLPLASLWPALAPSPDRGRASLEAQLAAAGTTGTDMLANVQGDVTADLQNARLPVAQVQTLPAPWASVAAPWFASDQGTIDCTALAVRLSGDGRAVVPAAMASTPRADILATGDVALVERELALQLIPSARDGNGGRPLLPLRVAGPWQAPEVGVANLALADRTARALAGSAAQERTMLAIQPDERAGQKPCKAAVARLRDAPPLAERLAQLERRLDAALDEADGELAARLEELAARARELQDTLAERGRALERELTPLLEELQKRLEEEGKRLREELEDTF